MKRLVTNLAAAAALITIAAVSIDAQPARVATHQPAAPPAVAPAAAARVNVNSATLAQLALLPGVGKVIAQRIAEYRTEHGQFRQASDLRQVKGIGDKTLAGMLPYVSMAGRTTVTAKIHAAKGGVK